MLDDEKVKIDHLFGRRLYGLGSNELLWKGGMFDSELE